MRQGVAPLVGLTTYVSIHASVKDATVRETDAKVNLSVSIHASVKDATLFASGSHFFCSVSIHASVKDATTHPYSIVTHHQVSIHASVKDATGRWCFKALGPWCFNPRICKRCDHGVRVSSQCRQEFQSTHL